eukprot:COSAG06_NODE_711_length_12877_cov_16.318281_2_plen_45_part_00
MQMDLFLLIDRNRIVISAAAAIKTCVIALNPLHITPLELKSDCV